jgi:cell division septum initiation protein DivIVA
MHSHAPTALHYNTLQEIERLNEECLELEDQVQALKEEVKEAWESYKTSQERAAIRETELQDEIRQVRGHSYFYISEMSCVYDSVYG